jgi:hypothetical protein
MQITSNPPTTPAGAITSERNLLEKVMDAVRKLESAIRSRQPSQGLCRDVECALAALPLAADEFTVMKSRLMNAVRYLRRGERGAASFELRLVAGSLTR